ncbi:hypothetical protein HYH02_002262 [Chlamydomonas schloesseri]|uniref:ABM domain-containing protein n=1 Tax=Chlamydomonas schloesseri TaxID=2026947 RepID=A0A836BBH8_9CHLO|nr:hypothetical protein HYH02_002262 [Chlamydomonas schloesseri]|eukprot:KAG2452919.1 hypothetical protein HYH02_002262 [Chlamydomonas schloesseri]
MARSRGAAAMLALCCVAALAVACGARREPTALRGADVAANAAAWTPAALRLRDSPANAAAVRWIQERLARRGKGDMGDEPAYFGVKYEVPPHMHDKFMKEWMGMEKTCSKAKGLDFFQMSKTLIDNTDFWTYTEWETFEDWMDHCENSDVKDFIDFCEDNDILVTLYPFEAAGDTKREYRSARGPEVARRAAERAAARRQEQVGRRRGKDTDADEVDPRDTTAHIAVNFHVPPSTHTEFEDAFEDIQDRVVDKEDSNRFYVLRKFATMNHHYVLRGGWDDLDAYMDHITSKSFHNLRQMTEDNDIEWYAEPFHVVAGSYDEGKDTMAAKRA